MRSSPAPTAVVADDERLMRDQIVAQLKEAWPELVIAGEAANGREAVALVQSQQPDIVFLDIRMPEMDGIEATRLIRKRESDMGRACPWPSPVHIIALTANAMQGDREIFLAAGMDDYISKPMRLSELQAALGRWYAATNKAPSPASPTIIDEGYRAPVGMSQA